MKKEVNTCMHCCVYGRPLLKRDLETSLLPYWSLASSVLCVAPQEGSFFSVTDLHVLLYGWSPWSREPFCCWSQKVPLISSWVPSNDIQLQRQHGHEGTPLVPLLWNKILNGWKFLLKITYLFWWAWESVHSISFPCLLLVSVWKDLYVTMREGTWHPTREKGKKNPENGNKLLSKASAIYFTFSLALVLFRQLCAQMNRNLCFFKLLHQLWRCEPESCICNNDNRITFLRVQTCLRRWHLGVKQC